MSGALNAGGQDADGMAGQAAEAPPHGRRAPMTVRMQLGLAFGTLIVLMLVVALLSLRALQAGNEDFKHFLNVQLVEEQLAMEVRLSANRRAIALRNVLLADDGAARSSEQKGLDLAQDELRQALAALGERVRQATKGNQRERELVSEMERVEAAYLPIVKAITDLAAANDREGAVKHMRNQGLPLLEAMRKATADFAAEGRAQSAQAVQEAEQHYAGNRMVLLATCAGAAVLSTLLALLITRRLVAALGAEPAALGEAARRVAAGDLDRKSVV